ncbi:MAG: hypothetical protein JWN46_1737 [Acidimicrobiales bacterium]|nr:hypothetical protein [Acidimicrobiales bacterium]
MRSVVARISSLGALIFVALALAGAPAVDAALSTRGQVPAPAPAATAPTVLRLQNGWYTYFRSSAAAALNVSGVVHLKGAIATSGTNPVAFTMPTALRPTRDVYVQVDLCNATNGRLWIKPTGVVTVQAESGAFSNAQCFTSLDGASYALSAGTGLTLVNGWTGAPFSTSQPTASVVWGAVHLKGAIASGTTSLAFTLPAKMRPATVVYAPVDLCNATNGRLIIQPSGTVSVQVEGGTFSNAQCFTSLDGAWFALSGTAVTLVNGWTGGPFGTAQPATLSAWGVVQFRGAIGSGTNSLAFTLPTNLRPKTVVYVYVDMCNATNGRLIIQPNGQVSVQAESSFSNAQCFTSLEGASFLR